MPKHKLTPDQIEAIRAERAAGVKLDALASEYNVSTATIFYHTAGVNRYATGAAADLARSRREAAEEARAQLCKEYELGATVVALAKKYEVTEATIRSRIARAGGKLRGPRKRHATDAQIARLYRDKGLTMREVASTLRVAVGTVCKRLKKMNIPARCKAKKETR